MMVIPVFVTIYEIFANQIKCEKFEFETGGQGQGEKRDLLLFLNS